MTTCEALPAGWRALARASSDETAAAVADGGSLVLTGPDASRVRCVLAGTDLSPLPPPVIDRFAVISVPAPDPAQVCAIAPSVHAGGRDAARRFYAPSLGEALIDGSLDAKPWGIRKAIAEAVTRAAADERRATSTADVDVTASPGRGIGFR